MMGKALAGIGIGLLALIPLLGRIVPPSNRALLLAEPQTASAMPQGR